MACACRISSLQLFVRGLTQVHNAGFLAPRNFQRAPTLRPSTALRVAFSTTPLSRSDTAEKPAEDGQAVATVQADGPSSSAAPTSSDSTSDLTWTIEPSADAKDTSRGSPKPRSVKPKRKSRKAGGLETEGKTHSTDGSIATSSKPSSGAKRAAGESDADPAQAPPPQHRRENWQLQKDALKKKFPEGWRPMKRLSPDAVAGIRALHAQFPEEYTTAKLVEKFEISPEAVRRILKSKWQPSPQEEEERQTRWFRRGKDVWARYAELGMKPPQKWRAEGVTRDPTYHEKRQAAIARRKEEEAKEAAGARLQRKMGGGFL
ncbi:Required for respiratory growth protein 9 like [Verticillium longisporum]|uniref:Required for respiratory growth protein 9, mitochondrial n=1 Tax=Verticillium longisporum TaxID=100787 RepID=A0A0G4KEF4_VERLO|nr:Required for respiratory growth protein 9 like [Verticillium longisporum]CRJ84704.1 hypothetical protein BN1708_009131 [Verticillium longisporum]